LSSSSDKNSYTSHTKVSISAVLTQINFWIQDRTFPPPNSSPQKWVVSTQSCTKLNTTYKGISLKIEHPEGRSSYTRINTEFYHSFHFFNSKILNLCFPARMYGHTLVYIKNNHFNLGLELFNAYHATACVLWEYV